LQQPEAVKALSHRELIDERQLAAPYLFGRAGSAVKEHRPRALSDSSYRALATHTATTPSTCSTSPRHGTGRPAGRCAGAGPGADAGHQGSASHAWEYVSFLPGCAALCSQMAWPGRCRPLQEFC